MIRLAKAALLLVSCLVGVALGEVALRAIDYRYSPVQIGAGNGNDHRSEHAFNDRYLVYDRRLIWRPVSSQFAPFNPQGFRGAPIDREKPPGTLRVIAIGDSNTFGWAVDEGVNWPAQLEVRLAEARPGARVVNAGVWGYTLFQGRRRFDEVLAFTPDLVLVSFGGNDAHQVTVPDADYVRRHDRIARLVRATEHVRLAQLAVAAWDGLAGRVAAGPLVPRVPLDDYRRFLREIVRTSMARGVVPVLLTRPFVGASTDPTSWKTHAPAYNAATLEVGRAEGALVVDVHAAFVDRADLFDDESHFGAAGHARMADLLRDALAPVLPQ